MNKEVYSEVAGHLKLPAESQDSLEDLEKASNFYSEIVAHLLRFEFEHEYPFCLNFFCWKDSYVNFIPEENPVVVAALGLEEAVFVPVSFRNDSDKFSYKKPIASK